MTNHASSWLVCDYQRRPYQSFEAWFFWKISLILYSTITQVAVLNSILNFSWDKSIINIRVNFHICLCQNSNKEVLYPKCKHVAIHLTAIQYNKKLIVSYLCFNLKNVSYRFVCNLQTYVWKLQANLDRSHVFWFYLDMRSIHFTLIISNRFIYHLWILNT